MGVSFRVPEGLEKPSGLATLKNKISQYLNYLSIIIIIIILTHKSLRDLLVIKGPKKLSSYGFSVVPPVHT